tara:strand:+ start:51 stop:464 length:414 start_codon:yes stop_codon:yes gene_type:complete
MKKATKAAIPFQVPRRVKIALCFHIAGFYTAEELIGTEAWFKVMWAIFNQISNIYSNVPEDPRPNFTSLDSTKIFETSDLEAFEKDYPEIAKVAKAKADLADIKPQSSTPTEPKESPDLMEKRIERLEEMLAAALKK